jgi:hypothetical protein
VIAGPSFTVGHPERTTVFPNLHVGKVPKVRHSGKALYVCRPDSARLVKKFFDGKQRKLRLSQVKRCRFRNIQAAINHAKSGYRIRILPGVYKEKPSRRVPVGGYEEPPCNNDYVETEGFTNTAPPPAGPRSNDPPVRPDRNYQVKCPNSKNLIEIVGDPRHEPDPQNPIAPKCLQLCHLQVEGLGKNPRQVKIIGDRKKLDVFRVDRANGVVLRNFLVEQSAFNGIDFVEANGFRVQDIVARYNQDYGILSFTSVHGLYNRITAYGNGDSGVYPGSNQKGCDPDPDTGICGDDPGSRSGCGPTTTEIKNSNSYGNTLGYSGTAGNSTYLHYNRFHDNANGISTDSFAAGHPGMPQECAKWVNNKIYSNNHNIFTAKRQSYCGDTPFVKRKRRRVCPQFQVPVGTGIIQAGSNRNLVARNQIWDNWRAGVLLFYVPATLRGDNEASHQQDTSNGNRYIDNKMSTRPGGKVDPNGVDFLWDGAGQGNCADGNKGAHGAATMQSNPLDHLPGCSSPLNTNVWTAGDGTTVPLMASCASWDPKNAPRPPGCDWFDTPPEPQP